MNCDKCKYWKDYSDRVYARISEARSSMERNRIELRICRYIPPPTVSSKTFVYTDKDYSCSGFSCNED